MCRFPARAPRARPVNPSARMRAAALASSAASRGLTWCPATGVDTRESTEMLPASVRSQVTWTTPSWSSTLLTFLIGNLFCNFLLVVGVICWAFRAANISLIYLAAIVAVYYAWITSTKAHITGWRSGKDSFLRLFRNWIRYFDASVIMDGGIEPGKQYVFCCSPHGIHGFGTGVLMDEASPFFERFPFLRGKLVGLGAWILFQVPLVRELFLLMGWRDASRSVADRAIREGNSIYLIVGGEAESLLSRAGHDDVVVAGKRRRGFAKLALENGCELVPFYMFHNSDTYATSSWLYGWRKWLSARYQICVPLWWGRWFTPLPFNVKLTVAIGKPVPLPAKYARPSAIAGASADADAGIKGAVSSADAGAVTDGAGTSVPSSAAWQKVKATEEDVIHYQAAYIQALTELFEAHKAEAGYPKSRTLNICESA